MSKNGHMKSISISNKSIFIEHSLLLRYNLYIEFNLLIFQILITRNNCLYYIC